jgi:hypothetical protein
MKAARPPKPLWPMRWVVLAVVVAIPLYTFLTLHFRKASPAFHPYGDLRDRADVVRLLSAGYRRIGLEVERPAEPRRVANAAPTETAPGGIPAPLKQTLIESPLLPAAIQTVSAPATLGAALAYPIELTCSLSDHKRQVSGAHLYLRGTEILILPDFERLPDGLLARSQESVLRLTVPAGTFKPGAYRVTLVGEKSSRAWPLQVR